MFGKTHLLYMLVTALICAVIIVPLFILKKHSLNLIAIKFFAVLTLVIQYSPLWIDFLTLGSATVDADMLFPIHPCNICMWLLMLSSIFIENKSRGATILRDFTFWGGVVCGTIGTVFNFNFIANPDLGNYFILKGLLTHTTMVAGCILLFTSGIVKIRVSRGVLSVFCGLCLFAIDGFLINLIYSSFNLPPCNSMYLLEAPFNEIPWLTTPVIGLFAMITVFIISAVFEQFALPKEKRWYKRLAKYFKERATENI